MSTCTQSARLSRFLAVLAVLVAALAAATAPAASGAGHGTQISLPKCALAAGGALGQKRLLGLAAARFDTGKIDGLLLYHDGAGNVDLRSTRITSLIATKQSAFLQGFGTVNGQQAVRFSAGLDVAGRSFTLQLSNGYAGSGSLKQPSVLRLVGTCPFDGNVTIETDSAAAVTESVGPEGGAVSAGGETLIVPAGALKDAVEITVTPLTSIAGSPFDATLVAGARFSPDGLQFLKPASLTFALPAGVAPSDVVGFAGDGSGTDVHLVPSLVSNGQISVPVSHFSVGGASSGGAGAAQAAATYTPSTTQKQAEQAIAAAIATSQSGSGPLIQTILESWFDQTVLPGLQASIGRDEPTLAKAVAEWQGWEGNVEMYNLTTELADRRKAAHATATEAAASIAENLLNRCTGFVDMRVPLRDVIDLSAHVVTLELIIEEKTLPDGSVVPRTVPDGRALPDGIRLPAACAHAEITQLTHPAAFAVDHDNTITAQVEERFWNGPARTDQPIVLKLEGGPPGVPPKSLGSDTVTNGTWQMAIKQTATNPWKLGPMGIELYANPELGVLNSVDLGDKERFNTEVRERVELQARRPQDPDFADSIGPVRPGQTVTMRVRAAGDGMDGATVGYALTGPGSLGAASGTVDASGEAQFAYTAAATPPTGTADVRATFDGTTDTVSIAIQPGVTVSISPSGATVAPGGTVQFAATVANVADQSVGWGASGGSIDQNGLFTAGSTPGTYAVTAVSVEDPTASASVTVIVGGVSLEGLWEGVWRQTLTGTGGLFAYARIFPGPAPGQIDIVLTRTFPAVSGAPDGVQRALLTMNGSTFSGKVYQEQGGATIPPTHPLAAAVEGSLVGDVLTIIVDRKFVGQDGVTIFTQAADKVFELKKIG